MSYTIKGMDKFLKLSEQIPKEPEAWTCDEVSQWLRLIEMEQYVEDFRLMSIDGWLIFEIEEEDLINDLKVNTKLHRKKIMKGIKMLQEYKLYIRNSYTKKDPSDEGQRLVLEAPPKPANMALEIEEPDSQRIQEEKDQKYINHNLDAQTRHQDMNSKFMFGNNSGKFLLTKCRIKLKVSACSNVY